MIDYDEMNEVLASEERMLAEQEAARERELESELIAKGWKKDMPYEACLEGLRRVRTQIGRMQSWVHEDFEKAETEEAEEINNFRGLLLGFAFHSVSYPALFFMFARVNVIAFAAFALLALLWGIYTVIFFGKVLDYVTTYRVMMSRKGTEEYSEDQKILTFRARKERCRRRLQVLREQLTRLDACENQVHRMQGLSGTAYDSLQALINVPEAREEFSDKKNVTFREFREWKKRKSKV